MNQPGNRRIRKTKTAVLRAFGELMQEKRFENITIQNIIDRADIGRTTFYAHYETKDELLEQYISCIFDLLTAQEEQETFREIPLKKILEHIKGHSGMVKGALNASGGEILFQRAEDYWRKKLGACTPGTRNTENLPQDILINHFVTSAVGLIRWWLKNDMPYTPAEMERFWKVLMCTEPV